MLFTLSRSLAALLLLSPALVAAQASVSLTAAGAAEDFDTLANAGSPASTLPGGWYLSEGGSNANLTYSVGDGAATAGDTYSFGTGSSTERAFGGLRSGSLQPRIGARISNNTGTTLNTLPVSYVGEQWRLGATGRTDRLDFQYSLDATSLSSGTWVDVDALDFAAPVQAGSIGPLNGNLAANRTLIAGEITGLSLPTGQDFWVRWSDLDPSGADDGLAIDDLVFGTPVDHPPFVAGSSPAHNDDGVAFDTAITVTFSEPVETLGAWFAFDCGAGTPALTPSAGPATAFTLTPAAPIGYDKSCELTILANQVRDLDETQDLMEADATIQFETEADNAPIVIDSTPATGATDVARGANLSVTFSEPVEAPESAFLILCPATETLSLDFVLSSDDDITFMLDPADDLPPGTACRLDVLAAEVTDRDGVADTPIADEHIGFTTAAQAPPLVLSTVPAAGAANFPVVGDLQIEFDQNVTLAAGAFTLVCDESSGIALLPNASTGSSFTIDTGTTLVEGDACTFTTIAAKVSNDAAQTMASNKVVVFSVAGNNSGDYYQNVNLSSHAQLRCTLHETIAGHTVFPYSWTVLEIADEAPPDVCAAGQNSPNQYILDIYRNRCYAKPGQRSGGTGPNFYNREHTWPKSLGFGGDPSTSKPPSTDFHMLHLSASDYNSTRSNKPFDNCNSGCTKLSTDVNNGTGGTSDANSNFSSGSVFEVWDGMKGNMARAVMYMAIRYEGDPHPNGTPEPDLELTNNLALVDGSNPYMGKLDTLLEWHAFDQVIAREHERNEVVYTYQGNRNPFVDHPEWATLELFESESPAQCVLNVTAPAANDDNYATTLNTPLLVAANDGVLSNDSDAEGAPLSAELVSNVGSGTLALAANGGFTYTPATDFCGTASFTYRASDGVRLSAPRTATIAVGTPCGSNNPPVANDDNHPVNEDSGTAVVNVLANDSIAPDVGETLTVTAVTQGALGSVSLVAGVVSYTPNPDANGSDSFTYTISDGNGGTDTATVHVAITAVNDAPQASDDILSIDEDSGASVVNVLANDSIAPDVGETLTVTAVSPAALGSVSLVAGVVSYSPNPDANGGDSFTYTVSDGNGGTDTATVNVTIAAVNDAPQASDDSLSIDEDGSASVVNVLANDSIAPDVGETLTVTAVTQGTLGSVSLVAGVVSYTPNPDANGSDSFTYTVSDGNGGTDIATVNIAIASINDAPVIAIVLADRSGQEDVAITPFSVADGFADDDVGDVLDFTQNGLPAGLVFDPGSGMVSGTPAAGTAGNHTVVITASDGEASIQQTFAFVVTANEPLPPAVFSDGFED